MQLNSQNYQVMGICVPITWTASFASCCEISPKLGRALQCGHMLRQALGRTNQERFWPDLVKPHL